MIDYDIIAARMRDLAKLEMIAGYLNIPLRYLLFGEWEDIEKEDDFT